MQLAWKAKCEMRMNDHAKRLFNYLFSPKGCFPFSSNIQISRIFLWICVNKYFHLRLFCFWLIRSFWQERRRIERRQMDQRRKKQGPRLQRTRLFESMCLFISVHWFKIRCLLRKLIFCYVCNICNTQFSVQLEELERAFERAPYPDVFASEVSSVLLCIENIEILENIKQN